MRATRYSLAGREAGKFDAEMRRLRGALRYLKGQIDQERGLALEAEFAGDDFASAAIEGAILRFRASTGTRRATTRNPSSVYAGRRYAGLDAAVERGGFWRKRRISAAT